MKKYPDMSVGEILPFLRFDITESEMLKMTSGFNSAFGKAETPSLNHDPFRLD
jgi:hypothetical protein